MLLDTKSVHKHQLSTKDIIYNSSKLCSMNKNRMCKILVLPSEELRNPVEQKLSPCLLSSFQA